MWKRTNGWLQTALVRPTPRDGALAMRRQATNARTDRKRTDQRQVKPLHCPQIGCTGRGDRDRLSCSYLDSESHLSVANRSSGACEHLAGFGADKWEERFIVCIPGIHACTEYEGRPYAAARSRSGTKPSQARHILPGNVRTVLYPAKANTAPSVTDPTCNSRPW